MPHPPSARSASVISSTRVAETSDPAIVIDASRRVTHANDPALALLGQDLIGREFPEGLTIRSADALDGLVEQMCIGRVVTRSEVELHSDSGKTQYLILSGGPFCADGVLTGGAIVTLTDITPQKIAQRDLRSTAERLRVALETAKMFAWEWVPATDAVVTSDNVIEVMGTRCTTGQQFFALIHPEDRDHAVSIIEQSAATGRDYAHRYRVRQPDGTFMWVADSGRVEVDQNGHVIRLYGLCRSVTDEVEREQALRASESEYRTMFEHSGIGKARLDLASGRFVRVNERFCRLLGYSCDDLLGRTSSGITHPDDRGDDERMLGALRSGEARSISGEKRFLRSDGATVWARVDITVLPDPSGRAATTAISSITDITELKKAQRELAESARRFALAVRTAGVTVYTCDSELRYTWIFNATGPFAQDVIGKRDEEILPAEVVRDLSAFKRRALRSPGPIAEEVTLEVNERKTYWRMRAEPIFEHDSAIGLRVAAFDVTEIRERELAARRGDRNIRRLVDSNVIGVMFSTEEGALPDMNDYVLSLLGYTREELRAGKIRWPDITPPEYLAADVAGIEEAHRTGSCSPYEKEYIRKDGTRVPVVIGYTRLEGTSNEYVCFVLDLTAHKAAQQEREQLLESERRAREEAEAASQAKDEFLAILSHELRTPMTSILGWSSMLQMGMVDGKMMDLAVRSLHDSAKTQTRLIEDLLDISRATTGKLALQYGKADVRETLLAAVEGFRLTARSKNISLRMHILATEPLIVLGDANRIQQIISNLIANALKFTPVSGWIDVELLRDQMDAVVVVRDSGCGIDPEFLPQVFDRFSQQDSSGTRVHGGLGLGLSIVRHITELHGGTVEARSEGKGCGSEFIVRLPILVGESDDAALEIGRGFFPRLDGVRVLVVDDQPENRTFMGAVMESCGALVDAAESAKEAFRLLEERSHDVLVSDIAMPDEDGYSLLYRVRIREAQEGRRTPALAVSAYGENDRERVLAAGFDEFIPKPVHPADLARAIATVLGR